MKEFNIIKRNRKYFAAKTQSGHNCKILIDTNSENLELGEQTLVVDDISVRSKYGVDLIFKLKASAEEQKSAGICTLRAKYNKILVDKCRILGGKWDGEEQAWIFSTIVADQVEELDEKYNSVEKAVEITFAEAVSAHQEAVYLSGFKIAQAWGRDSGAKIAEDVSFVTGEPRSGGSMKNWRTVVDEGCVLRMSVPEQCLEELIADNPKIVVKVI